MGRALSNLHQMNVGDMDGGWACPIPASAAEGRSGTARGVRFIARQAGKRPPVMPSGRLYSSDAGRPGIPARPEPAPAPALPRDYSR